MKNKLLFVTILILLIFVFRIFFSNTQEQNQLPIKIESKNSHNYSISHPIKIKEGLSSNQESIKLKQNSKIENLNNAQSVQNRITNKTSQNEIYYNVDDDGLATVDGDIVLGAPNEVGISRGKTTPSNLELWPGGKIPFLIQANLEKGERVIRALTYFTNTPIQFSPYKGEQDVLVFESANEGCKSYLGKIGGKQPIWISLNCGPREIAHEIMHALGFIHEQNRSDRDSYITILWDNIIESSKLNFESFPITLMKVSGSQPFDFNSIMLYPSKMFSKNGYPVMQSLNPQNEINPNDSSLSNGDLIRLENIYLK